MTGYEGDPLERDIDHIISECPKVGKHVGDDPLLERLRKYHVEPRSPPPAGLEGGSSD